METRTQIVTQLVAALLTSDERMQHIRNGMHHDIEIAVAYANMVADEIINTTTEEIVFPETIV